MNYEMHLTETASVDSNEGAMSVSKCSTSPKDNLNLPRHTDTGRPDISSPHLHVKRKET
ncbi:hypothetical protein HOLleu_16003 [Holothuria leucospilota]|uniref:Uncharacterized protein n=1 Tax=Holothuria leucospilota TaxID=206669 RepID=A0A9Q1HAT9_HOLLE|nr:hypothetical protein HOLleu_16003 [Holothuria leucospilota]